MTSKKKKTLRSYPKGFKIGKYKSGLELTVKKSMPKKKGVKVAYETHKIPYYIPGNYFPDFVVSFPNGRIIYIECKGWFRPEDKRKMSAVLSCNPGIDIRMVFQSNNSRNIAWCRKNNIPWAVGCVPESWFVNE